MVILTFADHLASPSDCWFLGWTVKRIYRSALTTAVADSVHVVILHGFAVTRVTLLLALLCWIFFVLWLVWLVIWWLAGFSLAGWSPLTLAGWKAARALSARYFDLSLSNLPHLISQVFSQLQHNPNREVGGGGTGLESWLSQRERETERLRREKERDWEGRSR